MELYILFFVGLVFTYFLCGVPFALVIGKRFFSTDPRDYGSGNLGATNTFRVLGARAAIFVLCLDALKGALAIMVMRLLLQPVLAGAPTPDWALMSTLIVAVLGHVFSPYIHFKGGKGVATTAGCLFAIQPIAAFICLGVFIVVVYLTRYVSLGSITIAALYPFLVLVFYRTPMYVICAFGLAVLIIWLHRSNIVRLRAGNESKISFSKRGSKPQKEN